MGWGILRGVPAFRYHASLGSRQGEELRDDPRAANSGGDSRELDAFVLDSLPRSALGT
jgi:hypothetical protein